MSYRQSRHNNIPVSTRQDEEIQTDVNLLSRSPISEVHNEMVHSSKFFEFCSEQHLLRPFSDYYLLSQFQDLLGKLKNQTASMDQFKSQELLFQLSRQVHGLLTRELRLNGESSDYYKLIGEKEKQILALQIKNSYKDKYLETALSEYERKIADLQQQIRNLRLTLDRYQTAEEENIHYRKLFKSIKQITLQRKNQQDFIKIVQKQISPILFKHEIDMNELSKKLAKDRTNKAKAALSKYVQQLNQLSNQSNLKWQTLYKSFTSFFTSLEHMKDDSWIRKRLTLSEDYEELSNRHIATLSLIEKTFSDFRNSNSSSKALAEFEETLRRQAEFGFKTVIIDGWVGLGTIHCHRHNKCSSSQDLSAELLQYRTFLKAFQCQMKTLIDKYPQLRKELDENILVFLETEISGEIVDGECLGKILEIIVNKTKVVTVQNVYEYYSKSDKKLIFNLRVLIKALLDKLEEIRKDKGINIDLDEGILCLLRQNILDVCNLEDILSVYRPPARICEVDRVIVQPQFISCDNQIQVPINCERGIPLNNIKHIPIEIQKMVPIKQTVNQFITAEKPITVPSAIKQIPILVPQLIPTPIYQTITREQKVEQVVERNIYTEEIKEHLTQCVQQIVVQVQKVIQKQVPFEVQKQKLVQVQTKVPQLIPQIIQYAKVIHVPTNIPVFVQKPIYEVVEKPVPYIVKREEPVYVPYKEVVIEKVEVAVPVDRLIEKRVDVSVHCDCQKPDIHEIKVQVPIIKELEKQVLVQKAHFVKGDEIQKQVKVQIIKQVPFIHQIVRQVEFCVQKLAVQEVFDERLVVVEKQKPVEIIKYEPVQIFIEKPVFLRSEIIKQVKVQVPIPIIIEKEVCKVVQARFETIVEKTVEVPTVQIVQKIVQKIVPIPRIIQKIVTVPQIIEKCVFLEKPCLEIVEIQREVPVIEKREEAVLTQICKEKLRIQKQIEYVDIKGQTIVLTKTIREPVEVEVVKQKVVELIREVQRQVQVEVLVPLIHKIVETIPVQVIREKAIIMEKQVAVVQQIPIFYKQPEVIVHDNVLEVEKIVQIIKEETKICEIQKPVIIYEERAIQVPSEPIIQIEKELELVYVTETKVETVQVTKSQPHYIYADKVVPLTNQVYVQPNKVVEYLNQPQEIQVQKMIPAQHTKDIPVEYPSVRFKEVRTIVENPNVERFQKPVVQVVYDCKQPDVIQVEVERFIETVVEREVEIEKQIPVVDVVEKSVIIECEKIVSGLKQIIRQGETRPEYIQKIIERVVMFPQIVEVEKKVFMVEEMNTLISKEVNSQIYKQQYALEVDKLRQKADALLRRLRGSKNRGDAEFLAQLQMFYKILNNVDAMPKIVEVPKQVKVEVQKDRPVLIPVSDHEKQIALQNIICKLIEGISKFKKEDIEQRFDPQILDIFFIELGRVKPFQTLEKCMKVIFDQEGQRETERKDEEQVKDYLQSRWKQFLSQYDESKSETKSLMQLAQSYKRYSEGYHSRKDDYATLRASMMKQQMQFYNKAEESDKLNIFYIEIIRQLWSQVSDLRRRVASYEYQIDKKSSDYASIMKSMMETHSRNRNMYSGEEGSSSSIIDPAISSLIREQIRGSRLWDSSGERIVKQTESSQIIIEKEKVISSMLQKLSHYEHQNFQDQKYIKQLQYDNDFLREDLEQLKNLSSVTEQKHHQVKNQVKVQWQNRVRDLENNYGTQINRLRDQLNSLKLAEGSANEKINLRNKQLEQDILVIQRDHDKEIKALNNNMRLLENEKKQIISDFERKMNLASNDQIKDLRKELDQLRQKSQSSASTFERQKQNLVNDYERKLANLKQSHEREIKQLKSKTESSDQQQSSQITRLNNKIKDLQAEIDNLRKLTKDQSSKLEIIRLEKQVQKLELQLDTSRKQVEAVKKSYLGKTAYTSGIKHSAYQQQFQSPESGIQRYRSPQTESEISKDQPQYESQMSRQSYGVRSQYRSRQREVQKRVEQSSEEVRSSSSRLSAKSGGSGSGSGFVFNTSMTMREFMDIKKIDDKDNILTFVMIKIIEKMIEESEKGILHSYTPNNIFFSNFNPAKLDQLVIKFGAPITNKKSKLDGLYLAPEIHQGKQTTLKSIVFTLGVIWDELIHYEIYFKTINEIENLGYEFKVRDSKMNPILKNTLFEMMSKDDSKRLELGEAKRRLSLQRYISSEGRPVATSSRVRRP